MSRKLVIPVVIVVLTGALALAGGCAKNKKAAKAPASKGIGMADPNSLYSRLGGEEAITAVVNDFVDRAAGDPKVNFTRKGHPNQWEPNAENIVRLKRGLVSFISEATSGPAEYQGRDMVTVHRDMRITDAEFDALVAHLEAALKAAKVNQKEINELVATVQTTRGEIVGK